MEVKNTPTERFHNGEHLSFFAEFKNLVLQYDPVYLNIAVPFGQLFLPHYQQEDEAFLLINKSSLTSKLTEGDYRRDRGIIGVSHLVKGYTFHFRPEIADAADRISILLDTYGNIARKSYDKETADINNLLQELRGDYSKDVVTLKLEEWIDELAAANAAFEQIRQERYTEKSQKTDFRMKDVRQEVDKSYFLMVAQINARITLEGEEKYLPFVKELNLRIDHYRTLVAQRKGIRKKKKEEGYDELD
jgi:hypothetical protein